jgi:hypothetical protein
MDETALTAPRDSEIINEVLSRKTYGFDSQSSPWDSEIINKVLSRKTYGFDSQSNP